jgi:hypothetical protein
LRLDDARHLRLVVDRETGEVQDDHDLLVAQLESELRSKNLQIARLKQELRSVRGLEPQAATIRDILEYWRERCKPRATIAPGGKRWEKVRARLNDRLDNRPPWTVEELKLAVEGALLDPWLSGSDRRSKGYLDAVTVFRDPEQVERLVELACGWQSEIGILPSQMPRAVLETKYCLPCDCGHARMEHTVPDPARDGRCPCLRCDCPDYDDLHPRAEAWVRTQAARQARKDARGR